MRTILLLIEYDGTGYAGWQVQPNGISVQEVVETALSEVLAQPVRLHSAGRTDAGVHARAMPAHFTTEQDLPLSAFREGVNRFLPEQIAVREAREMPEGFHARFAARSKWYRYTLYRDPIRSPLAVRTSWQVRGEVDLARLEEAVSRVAGRHDFARFRSSSCAARSTVRDIHRASIQEQGKFLHIDIHGSGFLKNMVRMLVGTLVEIARGRRPVADMDGLLALDVDLRAGPTAPPQGLCLMEVDYGAGGPD